MQERKESSRHDASPDQASAGEEEESLRCAPRRLGANSSDIRNRYGAVRRQMHEGRMTICRQNGGMNFVGVPAGGKKSAFLQKLSLLPQSPVQSRKHFSRNCVPVAIVVRRTARMSNACLVQAFCFWAQAGLAKGLAERKNLWIRHYRQRGAACAFHKKALRAWARRAFLWKYERFLKEGGVQGREGTFFRKEKFPPSPHILISS